MEVRERPAKNRRIVGMLILLQAARRARVKSEISNPRFAYHSPVDLPQAIQEASTRAEVPLW